MAMVNTFGPPGVWIRRILSAPRDRAAAAKGRDPLGEGRASQEQQEEEPPVPARRCPGFEAQADLTFIVFLLESLPARSATTARLAQSAERKARNLVAVGSSPTVGASCLMGRQGSPGGAMLRHAARVRVPAHVSRSGSRAARARRYLEHAHEGIWGCLRKQLRGSAADRGPRSQWRRKDFRRRELNPGLPRDRRKY